MSGAGVRHCNVGAGVLSVLGPRAIIVAIDQFAEAATRNRDFFLPRA
jgi:hypothetical protein